MVDDYLVSGESQEEVKDKLKAVTALFVLVGFSLAVEKEEIGQRISFLGVLIDTHIIIIIINNYYYYYYYYYLY